MEVKIKDTRPVAYCKFCGKDFDQKMKFIGSSWKYLEQDESSHPECYIEECVRKSLEKLKE